MSTSDWWLDIEERWRTPGDAGGDGDLVWNKFSVGPFQYNLHVAGEKDPNTISIQQFVDDINAKLAAAQVLGHNPLGAAYAPWQFGSLGKTSLLWTITPELYIAGDYTSAMSSGAAITGASWMAARQEFINLITSNACAQDKFIIRYTLVPTPASITATEAAYQGWQYDGPQHGLKLASFNGAHGANTPPAWIANEGTLDINFPYSSLMVHNNVSAPMVVAPSSHQTTIMLDDPPLPPNFRIVPYLGVDNRLLLLLNSNIGEYDARPILITEADAASIANIYLNQTGNPITVDAVRTRLADPSDDLKISYVTDDPISKYEIFRTTVKPTSYTDFDTSLHETVTTKLSPGKEASAASFIDSISSNMKYYYCARAIDVHNNVSNPTHIFEAELVDNEGQTYLILKPMLFDNSVHTFGLASDTSTEIDAYSKAGKRFILIEPSPEMSILDTTALDNVATTAPSTLPSSVTPSNNLLGPDNSVAHMPAGVSNMIWGNKYKVRVTSKKTNRQFDLNITFKNTGVNNP